MDVSLMITEQFQNISHLGSCKDMADLCTRSATVGLLYLKLQVLESQHEVSEKIWLVLDCQLYHHLLVFHHPHLHG